MLKLTAKQTQRILVLLLFAFSSQVSYALIGVQGLVGMHKLKLDGADYDKVDFSGFSLRGDVIIDPIPLVPLGVGVSVSIPSLSGKTSDQTKLELKGLGVDMFLTAWSPVSLAGVIPFGKVGYRVLSSYTLKQSSGTDVEIPYKKTFSGLNFAVGIKYSMIPLLNLLFQVSMESESMNESEGVTVLGVTSKLPKFTTSSTIIALGLEFLI